MKKWVGWITFYCLILAILIQGIALLNCEILTRQYHSDFEHAHKNNSMLEEIEYFKVLECDGTTATVYYVSNEKRAANILSFEKIDNNWEEIGWETVWSISGSASGTIWPYWWHFIYGGF